MLRTWRALLPTVLVVLLTIAGCATGPLGRRAVPDWVLNPPGGTDRYEYFVASGSDREADVAAAEANAAGALLSQIHQALGVDVSVLTTAEARATLDSYEASVKQEIVQSGGGRVEGFRIADRYVVEEDGRVTVHLLGEYERTAFLAERNARRTLLAEREALLLEPERRADADAAAGRAGAAVTGYLQAAAAAVAGSQLRIAPVVLERSLAKTVALVEGLSLRALDGPQQVQTGGRPGPIRFALSDSGGAAMVGMPLEISYPEVASQRRVVRRTTLVTDSRGIVEFSYPRVELVGDVEVTARVESGAYLSLLRSLPDSVRSQRLAIEQGLAGARASWRFLAVSRAREIATTLVVSETDASGAAIASQWTRDGLAQALSEAGFRLVTNDVDPTSGADRPQSEVIQHLQMTLPGDVRRVVLGSATISDFTQADGYLARVTATVTVVDLNTGEVIYTTSAVKNARSSNAQQALNTAFHQLGRTVGEQLAARLP